MRAPEPISDLDDPRVADYRNLRDGDLRSRDGLFMAEGRLNVRCLVEESRYRPRSIFLTPAALRALVDGLDGLDPEVPVYTAERAVFNAVAGFDVHRGCLAAGERGAELDPDRLLDAPDRPSTLVVLEGLTDVDNVGAVFRNARAFGAQGVLLCPRTCDPLYRKAIRTSIGATLCLPFARASRWPDSVGRLREAGYSIAALDPASDAVNVSAWIAAPPSPRRIALVLGAEGSGLSAEISALADVRIRIGMVPGFDSINVATAAAIALHYLHDRR